jgi:hypothetical protein
MINSLEVAKKSRDWLKENGQYIPYPATWLNAKGWEDEYIVNPLDGVLSEKGQSTIRAAQSWFNRKRNCEPTEDIKLIEGG